MSFAFTWTAGRVQPSRTCGRYAAGTTWAIGSRTSSSFLDRPQGARLTILGRNGVVMSDRLETTTRIRQIAQDRLLVTVVLTHSEALTRPWPVVFTYTRLPPDSTVYDYACAENICNPVTSDGRTSTLDPSGEVIDKLD